MNNKQETLTMLRTSEVIYTLISRCSNMPYVLCDPETYDDQILIFFQEDKAKEEAKRLLEAGDPVQVVKLENRMLLNFYTCLYPMGVNCMLVNRGTTDEIAVQLDDLITRPGKDKMPEGQVMVENPELHLTAIYFVQGLRKNPEGTMTEELEALNEEMTAHFRKGTYIVAVEDGKGIPVLQQKGGLVYQPIFTDFPEFTKFNKEKKFRAVVVESSKLADILTGEAAGIAINPFGVNVLLQIHKK